MSRSVSQLSKESIVVDLGRAARKAAFVLAQAGTDQVNGALADMADAMRDRKDEILAANREDLAGARTRRLSGAMMDRLKLTPERICAMAAGVEVVMALRDPVHEVMSEWSRPNGLKIRRVRVPIGVLGMIYESRPNVTADAAALCLKSRNAVILRGGSESLNSALALQKIVQEALAGRGLPEACVSMVPSADRAFVGAMLQADKYIDVMIPRGGRGLIERVMNEARMPVFAHLDGICHTYVHAAADPDLARKVVLNAKMRRTGICGATETLLLDRALPAVAARAIVADLLNAGCAAVGDIAAQKLDPRIAPASDSDWSTEYLDAKISIRTVDGVREAVEHINTYGSHHTDSILTKDGAAADYFLKNVDSAIVIHNASTQFADGGEFGMGAEIGIGTGKLHARGPVGVEQLTTYKYVVLGSGQTRA